MKAWLTRYLTETSPVAVFVTSSLVVVLVAVLIQLTGNTALGLTQFAQVVDDAKQWLLPLRLVVYAALAHYWWSYCRRSIARSTSPDAERRARNRISAAGALYMAAIEYGCWISAVEVGGVQP